MKRDGAINLAQDHANRYGKPQWIYRVGGAWMVTTEPLMEIVQSLYKVPLKDWERIDPASPPSPPSPPKSPTLYAPDDKFVDLKGGAVEILWDPDMKRLWVNIDGVCRLRVYDVLSIKQERP